MHLFRAKDRNRTYDRLITNQLLYQLSYFGMRPVPLTIQECAKFNKIYAVLSMKIKHLTKKISFFYLISQKRRKQNGLRV